MSDQRVKLLVLASTYPRWHGDHEPGFVHELSKRMSSRFEVTVLCPHAPGACTDEHMEGVRVVRFRYAPKHFETLVNDGGIVSNLKTNSWKFLLLPFFFIAQVWMIWAINRKWKPDIIHAHWLIPQGLAVALLRVLIPSMPPFYVTSHGADLFALKSRVFQRLKKFVISRAAGVSVVSSCMKQELDLLGCSMDKVSVLPMGVNLDDRFIPNEAVVRSHGEILFVGRLVEKKGLRYLLKAFPYVWQKYPEASITIVGFGPDKGGMIELANKLGIQSRVNFVGAVPQSSLAAYYQRASVFVAPFILASNGDQEGLGLVLVEALGCGCPVVVSDVPASRDVTQEIEGVTTVPMEDSQAIAEAIMAIFRQSGEARAGFDSSISELRQRFSWNSVAKSYAEKLSELFKVRG